MQVAFCYVVPAHLLAHTRLLSTSEKYSFRINLRRNWKISCLPSFVLRAIHKISLSRAIILYFQIKLFIASIHLLTCPVGWDLANSMTSTSQKERKCAVWKKNDNISFESPEQYWMAEHPNKKVTSILRCEIFPQTTLIYVVPI